MLLGTLARGGDPEARIKAGQTIPNNRVGRDIDVNRVCKQMGAEMIQGARLQPLASRERLT